MIRDQVDKLLDDAKASGKPASSIVLGEEVWGSFIAEVTSLMDTIQATTWKATDYNGVPLSCGGDPNGVEVR